MSPTIPFPHIYRLHYFLCGQTSKRRKRCPELLSRKPPGAEGGAAWSGHAVNSVWPRKKYLLSSFVFLKAHFTTPFHSFDKDAFPQQKGQKYTLVSSKYNSP